MHRSIHRLLGGVLIALGALLPLKAQLDPRLQVTTTDFMDLYQGITVGGELKPEILLLMDFSTSTNRMMFHPLFPNNWDDEDRVDGNSAYYDIYVTIAYNSVTSHYEISNVGFGRGTYQNPFPISSASFAIGGARTTYGTVPTNTLIKPDGTEVTLADVQATVASSSIYRSNVPASSLEAYALNWVRCASHVRMQCNVGGVIRNVDFPVNWAVLDKNSTGHPLSRVTVQNPLARGGDGAYYDIDTTYQGTANGDDYAALRESGNQYTAEIGSSDGLVRLYRSRYIQWIFTGKDASGAFYVPDAITPMASLDPATLAYVARTASYTYSTANLTATAFNNGLPNRSRNQAIKEAFLRTWFNNQDGVNFAYRSLYNSGPTSSGSVATPWSMDTNRWGLLDSGTPSTRTAITGQVPNSWQGTPLVPAQFDSYAQLAYSSVFADREAKLNKAQLDCLQHFLIMLTDGAPTINLPNEGANSFPYISATGPQSVYAGNTTVTNNLARFVQSDWYWNNPTMAAVAAHGGQRSSSTSSDWIRDPASVPYPGSTPQTWAPIWIQKRKLGGSGGTDYTLATPHPIQTMTVGVSLGSHYTTSSGSPWPIGAMPDATAVPVPLQSDPTGSKYRLLMTAMCGDPATTSLTASTIKPFYRTSSDGSGPKASDAAYFFDGRDPDTLVSNLQDAFTDIRNMSAVSTSTAPVIPFVGLGLSQQLYISRFIPSKVSTTPVWTGDLSMFSTRQTGSSLDILDKNGATVTNLSTSSPNWSADDALRNNRLWSVRKVWTRLHHGTSLVRFTPFDDGTGGAPAGAYSAIKASLATTLTTDSLKQQLIAWNLGADIHSTTYSTPDAPNPAAPNRSLPLGQALPPGDILGDIIDSTPAVVEYALTDWVRSQLSTSFPRLFAQVTAAEGLTPKATPHFRVIYVGTNRGFLHAFGEVAYTQSSVSGTTTTSIVHGDMDELWAFLPTDFLENLDDSGPSASLRHRYGVDGDPAIWFTDVPSATATAGNGMIDYNEANPAAGEKAMVVFGLRKGGRSYYGLNIQNPFTPALGWSLVPDEASSLTASVLDADCANGTDAAALTTVKSIVGSMGFSSCIPAFGRVLQGVSPKIREVVFLGGGYSTPEVEAQYAGTPLGRSALALDVQTGKVLAGWDMSSLGMGPVASGLVPFQFFLNSGYVQRVYFTDYMGGLWALGSTQTNASGTTYAGFRRDTNFMDQWTVDGARGSALAVRHVYQDIAYPWRSPAGANNAIYSMRPAPFLVGNYPGVASWTDPVTGGQVSMNPAAVGIAMESGDRDNPLDKFYTTITRPQRHRMTVVFDRQDSARPGLGLSSGYITNANLRDFTAQTAAPASNYLNDSGASTAFGYYLDFPDTYSAENGVYTPKGIYEPIVIGGVLFYSYFTPNTSDCTGGNGNTYTVRICDVMYPAWPGNGNSAATTPAGCNSGQVAAWTGVSSPLGIMSTATAIQAGITTIGPGPDAASGIVAKTLSGQIHEKYPRVRTWRSVR